jgi:hypothetical protein
MSRRTPAPAAMSPSTEAPNRPAPERAVSELADRPAPSACASDARSLSLLLSERTHARAASFAARSSARARSFASRSRVARELACPCGSSPRPSGARSSPLRARPPSRIAQLHDRPSSWPRPLHALAERSLAATRARPSPRPSPPCVPRRRSRGSRASRYRRAAGRRLRSSDRGMRRRESESLPCVYLSVMT